MLFPLSLTALGLSDSVLSGHASLRQVYKSTLPC